MKLCCIFNYNPLYRYPIYQNMGEAFDVDFYFGDSIFEPLRQFDPNKLTGFVKYLKTKRVYKNYIWLLGVKKALCRKYSHYLLTGDPSIISNWLIVLYAKLMRKKVYCWCHGPKDYVRSFKSRLFLLGPFFKLMDGIFLYNNYNVKFVNDLGVKNESIHVIYNSLDTYTQTKLYNQIKPSSIYVNHFGNNHPVAIFIGRLQKRMKVQYLIEAQCILKQRGVHLNVVLVGPYMNGEDMEELVRQKGLQNQVWFYGSSYEESVNSELLYNADVCVAPGTVGLTVIHSLSYGTPCITHNHLNKLGPEFEAIVDGVTGSFFEEDDVDSLADKIQLWLDLPVDKREAVRNTARETILKNWSVDAQITLLKEVLI